ncbi:hypothetical protein V1291_003887 [Nitrobacteraceae bacterium AZCC 1564]
MSGNQKSDSELRQAAAEFIEAFRNAVAKSDEEFAQIVSGAHFAAFDGTVVDLNASVTAPLSKLVSRAAKLLGPKAAHERDIEKKAYTSAQATYSTSLTWL